MITSSYLLIAAKYELVITEPEATATNCFSINFEVNIIHLMSAREGNS